MRASALAVLIAVILTSCSIKETRRECPCIFEIDLSAFEEVSQKVSLDLNGKILSVAIGCQDSLKAVLSAPKSPTANVSVWSGVSRMRFSGGVLEVPAGEQSDSLFLFGASVPGDQETVCLKAVPHKQFASVLLRIADAPFYEKFEVKSNYGGIELTRGDAAEGNLFIPLEGVEGEHCFRLPRQGAGGLLVLEASDGYGNVHQYPLGEWILGAGYDWDALDLADIAVAADFTLGRFEVSVQEWERGAARDQIL